MDKRQPYEFPEKVYTAVLESIVQKAGDLALVTVEVTAIEKARDDGREYNKQELAVKSGLQRSLRTTLYEEKRWIKQCWHSLTARIDEMEVDDA